MPKGRALPMRDFLLQAEEQQFIGEQQFTGGLLMRTTISLLLLILNHLAPLISMSAPGAEDSQDGDAWAEASLETTATLKTNPGQRNWRKS